MKHKALFLDRDGVINDGSLYYTYKLEDFKILPDVIEAIKIAKSNNYLVLVVTNQSGIAKGIYTMGDVDIIHSYFSNLLKLHKTKIDGFYVCPHHPSVSECDCRKPKTGMLEQAIKDFNIRPEISYLIGDSVRDVQAAESMHIKGIRIEKNESILNIVKEIVAENS